MVELLLKADANVNAELFNGMTGLHWAAFNGHEDVVKLILARPEANLAIKDTFDRTPMLCAAEKDWRDIVQLLSPGMTGGRLPPLPRSACQSFDATVVDFGAFRDNKKQLVFKHSVYDLLYGWNEDTNKPKVTTNTKNVRHQPAFRWIHLPANNVIHHSSQGSSLCSADFRLRLIGWRYVKTELRKHLETKNLPGTYRKIIH